MYVCVVTTSYEGTSLTCRLQKDFLPNLTDIVNKRLKLAFRFGSVLILKDILGVYVFIVMFV